MLFPITCVDNFYTNPDSVREYALSLDYFRNDGDTYPGLRTKQLHEINYDFFNSFCNKIFSLFFDSKHKQMSWVVDTTFQKIYPYDCLKENRDIINSGWVHVDSAAIFAGVVYLNPSPNLDSGTSIYKRKENQYKNLDSSIRNNFYNNIKNISEDEYVKQKIEHNSQFFKTLEFKNQYNRMISYDSSYWHSQTGFLMDNEDFRLTQVFFVYSVECPTPPYLRCKENDIYSS